jgi:hypothetical protein
MKESILKLELKELRAIMQIKKLHIINIGMGYSWPTKKRGKKKKTKTF